MPIAFRNAGLVAVVVLVAAAATTQASRAIFMACEEMPDSDYSNLPS
jgi:hypothetical protein